VHLKKVSEEDPRAELFDSDWDHEAVLEARELAQNPAGRALPSGLTEEQVSQLERQHTEDTFNRLLAGAGRTIQMVEKEHGMVAMEAGGGGSDVSDNHRLICLGCSATKCG